MGKLDSSVRRTGRVTKTLLLRLFHQICREGYPSGNHALLLVRSCGSLLPEVEPNERTVLAHRIWEKLQKMGAMFDVSHYNALLKVYLQNEFKFSPTDFLAKMEEANVQPNRVTFQRLIAAYCESGDLEGASTILGFMKTKDLPITEAVFNSLVTGHARSGDMENAKNILSVMEAAGIKPGPDTYVALLTAHAERGDIESLKQTMKDAERAECTLLDRDILQVIFALAKSGHTEHIPEMIPLIKQDRGYVPDAMNFCLRLITMGHTDTAFLILKNFHLDDSSVELGNFFLKHCVHVDLPVEKICSYCQDLEESKQHKSPFVSSLFWALQANKIALSLGLMKAMNKNNIPIRQHYFYPLLCHNQRSKNIPGLMEVLKGMGDLGVAPDFNILTNYVFRAFPTVQAAQQALKEADILLKPQQTTNSKVSHLDFANLEKLHAQLSDPSFPPIDLKVFCGNVVAGFKKSDDAESMAKITELLCRDERFTLEGTRPTGRLSYFLCNLFVHMTPQEVQEQIDTLQKYLKQLKTRDLAITVTAFDGINSILNSSHVPELIQDVLALVDAKGRVSFDASVQTRPNLEGLERRLVELRQDNKPFSAVLKQTIFALCAEEKLHRALELKRRYEREMTAAGYSILIEHCAVKGNAEEALNLKREMSLKDPSVKLTSPKYISLVKVLASNGKLEEAVEILKEMKDKEVEISGTHVRNIFHLFNSFTAKGDFQTIRRLQETVFSLGLVAPNHNLCAPLVTAYLESEDLSGAVAAMMECQKRYRTLPRLHDVFMALLERGDTEQLQKAIDVLGVERGDENMLFDLYFAFLTLGRYQEARKIIETPGLRAKPARIQWFAEKCIASDKMGDLEKMVEMTVKLYACNRDEMYNYVLRLCEKTNNWEKAMATWTKMQEENLIPSERNLRLLADILRSNGQEVPFQLPEAWYTNIDKQKASPVRTNVFNKSRLLALCQKSNNKEAFKMLKEGDQSGAQLEAGLYDMVIRVQLAQGAIEQALEAMKMAESSVPGFKPSNIAGNLFIVTYSKQGKLPEAFESLRLMMELSQLPSKLAISRLVKALSVAGDAAGIEKVQSLMADLGTDLSLNKMMFVNNKALAHIKNRDMDKAVEVLEEVYTNPDHMRNTMSTVFKRVLESKDDEAFDKLSAMADRLANHFGCYTPSMDIFFLLLDMDKFEDAKHLLARHNVLADQRNSLIRYVNIKSRERGQVDKLKALQSLLPDFANIKMLYPYLMKCHWNDEDLPSAKTLHEQVEKQGIVMDELSLKRLAHLYHKAGEEAPFVEPTGTFQELASNLRMSAANAHEE